MVLLEIRLHLFSESAFGDISIVRLKPTMSGRPYFVDTMGAAADNVDGLVSVADYGIYRLD